MSGLDKITIEGINVLGHHGVDEAERQVGQRLIIDLELYLDLADAIAGDDLRKTVNYEAVCTLVERIAGDEEFLLLESLAADIAARVLEKFRPVEVMVRVKKVNLPIATGVASIAVEIRRLRED
ncbi:MAG: dihydroneopterin aldolase [Candidatus Eisenbacteria bacterium]